MLEGIKLNNLPFFQPIYKRRMRITGKYLHLLYGNATKDEDLPQLPPYTSTDNTEELEIARETIWSLFRTILRQCRDAWEYDCLWLAMNWGRCHMDGKHPDTADEEWDLLNNIITESYSEEICKVLFDRLYGERLRICLDLFFEET
jgi:hypothetical protein